MTDDETRLKFEPDPRQQRRIAVFRRVVTWGSVIVFAVAILLLVRFRPGPLPTGDTGEGGPPVTAALSAPDSAVRREFVPVRPRPLAEIIEGVFRTVERETGLATASIEANLEYVNSGVEPDLALVGTRLDSARLALRRVRGAESELAGLSGRVVAGSRYRFSVFQVAVEKHRKLLEEQLRDGAAMLDALRAAALAGEAGEAGIQQDIATSYLRQAENRARRVARQAQAVRQSSGELLRAGVE